MARKFIEDLQGVREFRLEETGGDRSGRETDGDVKTSGSELSDQLPVRYEYSEGPRNRKRG